MNAAEIKLKPKRLFATIVSTSFFVVVWFLMCMVTNAFLALDIERDVKFEEFSGLVFAFNVLTYQNYVTTYILTIYIVYFRISNINDWLKSFGDQENIKKEKLVECLRLVAILVDKICDTLESIKFCYTVNNLSYTVYVGFFSVLGVYANVSYFFRTNPSSMELFFSLLTLIWNFYYIPFLLSIFLISNWIKKEGKLIDFHVRTLLTKCSSLDTNILKKTNLITMQMQHRRPIISCGVYVIDWYFMFTLIATGFSYLVIIVQFDLKTF